MSAVMINADALHIPLVDGCVQCVVTSPPYWGLRDYGVDGQLGLERTPEEYVQNMVQVFREVWRVMRDDGTLWLNLGDSYATNGSKGSAQSNNDDTEPEYKTLFRRGDVSYLHQAQAKTAVSGLKPKDLVGIPWRVAFALQADGWYLRSDIIWSKPNPMPESVTDRPTKAHEYVFLMSKSQRYYYDQEAVREGAENRPTDSWEKRKAAGAGSGNRIVGHNASIAKGEGFSHTFGNGSNRNRRTVWTIATQPYSGAHFATFPEKLVEPCILAGTSERGCCPKCGRAWERVVESKGEPKKIRGAGASVIDDVYGSVGKSSVLATGMIQPKETTGWRPACTCDAGDPIPCLVLDPFAGSGTTGKVAIKYNRRFVGLELKPEYIGLAIKRLNAVQSFLV